MEISVYNTINSDLAINQEDGMKLHDVIKSSLPSDLSISFEQISRISTAFLNESIGKYAQNYPNDIEKLTFIYPSEYSILEFKVKDVIENALLGDEYSSLIDNAIASL